MNKPRGQCRDDEFSGVCTPIYTLDWMTELVSWTSLGDNGIDLNSESISADWDDRMNPLSTNSIETSGFNTGKNSQVVIISPLESLRRRRHPGLNSTVGCHCASLDNETIRRDCDHAIEKFVRAAQSFVFTDTPVMSQPEIKIPSSPPLFDASAKLTDENTRQHVKKFLEAFAVWIGRFKD